MGRMVTLIVLVSITLALGIDFDPEKFADKIASQITSLSDIHYKTIAIWKIDNISDLKYDEGEFRDSLTIKLIKLHRFSVTDRTRLQQLLQEIKFSGSELVDPTTMKKLGEMYGIDLFLYGTFYNNAIGDFVFTDSNITLVLKAIDVEKASIAWAVEVPIKVKYYDSMLDKAVSYVSSSLCKDKDYLNEKKIKRISFWDFGITNPNIEKQIVDKLTVKLVNDCWEVVDRENLDKLINEIKFSQTSGLVSADKAKEFGKIYGIDGFIFGNGQVHFPRSSTVMDSIQLRLQMIGTETGILQWGEEVKKN